MSWEWAGRGIGRGCLPRHGLRQEGLAGPWRTRQKQTTPRFQTTLFELFPHTRLDDNLRNLSDDLVRKYDICQSFIGIGRSQKLSKIATRCRNRCDRRLSANRWLLARLGPLPQLLSETRMAFLLLCCRQLHRQIEETIYVAFCMTLNKPDELLCRSHGKKCTRYFKC